MKEIDFIEVFNKLYKGISMDEINKIMAYEQGKLNDVESVELFQDLLNSGLVWKLQGHYGRTATALIEAGYIFDKAQI